MFLKKFTIYNVFKKVHYIKLFLKKFIIYNVKKVHYNKMFLKKVHYIKLFLKKFIIYNVKKKVFLPRQEFLF